MPKKYKLFTSLNIFYLGKLYYIRRPYLLVKVLWSVYLTNVENDLDLNAKLSNIMTYTVLIRIYLWYFVRKTFNLDIILIYEFERI